MSAMTEDPLPEKARVERLIRLGQPPRDRGEVLFLTGAGVSRPGPSNLPDFRGLVVDICGKVDTSLAAALNGWIL